MPSSMFSAKTTSSLVNSLRNPIVLMAAGTLAVMFILIVMPLLGLLNTTLAGDNREAWADVFNSRMSTNLLWQPLFNSILMGTLTAVFSTIIGGFLAWVVVMTRLPGRRLLGVLATIPFALPSFALALAWESVFRNDLVGGQVGILQNLGLQIPDFLAWGPIPIALTLTAHYFSLSFLLIATALSSVNGSLLEAAEITGASKFKVAKDIALPVVTPAVISGALLAFAEGVSNFITPALLGLPVRYHTLSTRLYGSITTGDYARGYVLSLVLIVVAAMIMYTSTRLTGSRKSFATITGKGGRTKGIELGLWGIPIALVSWLLIIGSTIVPGLVLLLSSLTKRTNDFLSGFTLHYWIGDSDPAIAQGQRGILKNPMIFEATVNTVLLGICVAIGAGFLGLLIAYITSRSKAPNWLKSLMNVVSFIPFLIPGIALGAAFIAQFGAPIGPIPSLYGTFAILVLAGISATIPFSVRAASAALVQVSADIEESAVLTGAGFWRRIFAIIAPLTLRGMFTGAITVFVQMVRDLSLVVLLATPAMPVLAVTTYQYSSENFTQLANAVTVVIALISVTATIISRRLDGKAQPWTNN